VSRLRIFIHHATTGLTKIASQSGIDGAETPRISTINSDPAADPVPGKTAGKTASFRSENGSSATARTEWNGGEITPPLLDRMVRRKRQADKTGVE
jgi:hypothetical protein